MLLRKPRSYDEIYNDLDDEVVGLFRILRTDQASRLVSLIEHTPFSRTEFEEAYSPTDDPMERARRLIIRSFMGFASNGHNAGTKTGFRGHCRGSNTSTSTDWRNYPAALRIIIERLSGVVIECKPALEIIRYYDTPETLHYLDPPYLPETRYLGTMVRPRMYRMEMTPDDHLEMIGELEKLKGMVVLSGYRSDLYEAHLPHWTRFSKKSFADGAKNRKEILWLNPKAGKLVRSGLPFG